MENFELQKIPDELNEGEHVYKSTLDHSKFGKIEHLYKAKLYSIHSVRDDSSDMFDLQIELHKIKKETCRKNGNIMDTILKRTYERWYQNYEGYVNVKVTAKEHDAVFMQEKDKDIGTYEKKLFKAVNRKIEEGIKSEVRSLEREHVKKMVKGII